MTIDPLHIRPIQPCSCGAFGTQHNRGCMFDDARYEGILAIRKREIEEAIRVKGPTIEILPQAEWPTITTGLIIAQGTSTTARLISSQKEADELFGKGSVSSRKLDDLGVFKTAEQIAQEERDLADARQRLREDTKVRNEGFNAGKQAAVDVLVRFMLKTDCRLELLLLAEVMAYVKIADQDDDDDD